jgi:hypothetical protein
MFRGVICRHASAIGVSGASIAALGGLRQAERASRWRRAVAGNSDPNLLAQAATLLRGAQSQHEASPWHCGSISSSSAPSSTSWHDLAQITAPGTECKQHRRIEIAAPRWNAGGRSDMQLNECAGDLRPAMPLGKQVSA